MLGIYTNVKELLMNPAYKLIKSEELLAHNWPFALAMCPNEEDGKFDGSCPCAVFHGDGFHVETHCWRSSCEHGCKY